MNKVSERIRLKRHQVLAIQKNTSVADSATAFLGSDVISLPVHDEDRELLAYINGIY